MIFFGLYLTIFATPLVAFFGRNRFQPIRPSLFKMAIISIAICSLSFAFGISFVAIEANAALIYFSYLFFGVCVVQLFLLKNVFCRVAAFFGLIPLVLIPIASVPAVLGVLFILGDYEDSYVEIYKENLACRATSYGNATTSNGGYDSRIYRVYGLIQVELLSLRVDDTREPNLTAQKACANAITVLKS